MRVKSFAYPPMCQNQKDWAMTVLDYPAERGCKGGLKGGKARAKRVSAEQPSDSSYGRKCPEGIPQNENPCRRTLLSLTILLVGASRLKMSHYRRVNAVLASRFLLPYSCPKGTGRSQSALLPSTSRFSIQSQFGGSPSSPSSPTEGLKIGGVSR